MRNARSELFLLVGGLTRIEGSPVVPRGSKYKGHRIENRHRKSREVPDWFASDRLNKLRSRRHGLVYGALESSCHSERGG